MTRPTRCAFGSRWRCASTPGASTPAWASTVGLASHLRAAAALSDAPSERSTFCLRASLSARTSLSPPHRCVGKGARARLIAHERPRDSAYAPALSHSLTLPLPLSSVRHLLPSLAEQLGGVVPSPHVADKIWLVASSLPALAPSAAAAGSAVATVSAPSPDVEGYSEPFFDEAGLTQVIGPFPQHLGLRGAAPLAALPTAALSALSAFAGTAERAAQGAEASALAQAAAAAQRMPGNGGQLKVSGGKCDPAANLLTRRSLHFAPHYDCPQLRRTL